MKNMDMRLRVMIGLVFGVLLCGVGLVVGALIGMKISSLFSIDNNILNFVVKGFIYYVSMAISIKVLNAALNIARLFQLANK